MRWQPSRLVRVHWRCFAVHASENLPLPNAYISAQLLVVFICGASLIFGPLLDPVALTFTDAVVTGRPYAWLHLA